MSLKCAVMNCSLEAVVVYEGFSLCSGHGYKAWTFNKKNKHWTILNAISDEGFEP